MGERVGLNLKKSEMNRDNSDSRMRRTDHSQSVNSSVDRILFLQKTVGNQAVSRLIRSKALQAKLRIGQPGDVYEQEADRVADAVMRMPEPEVQRQTEKEEEIQTKPLPSQTSEVVSDVETRINSIRGGGQPLPGSTRAFFEPRFGQDFSQVRVHADTQAAESARALNARAYTVGGGVVFGRGQYALEKSEGRRLLAHELTHVVQQKNCAMVPSRCVSPSAISSAGQSQIQRLEDIENLNKKDPVVENIIDIMKNDSFWVISGEPFYILNGLSMQHMLTVLVALQPGGYFNSIRQNVWTATGIYRERLYVAVEAVGYNGTISLEQFRINNLKYLEKLPKDQQDILRQFVAKNIKRVVIKNKSLNVHASAPTGNIVMILKQGDIVEVQKLRNPDWYRITNTKFTDSEGGQVDGYISMSGQYSRLISVQDTPSTYQQIVKNLVSDYNNITVFPAGQTTGGTTFGSPYVLNSGATVKAALGTQRTIHSNLITRIPKPGGQPNQFLKVKDVTGTSQAFVGKGSPEAIQVIAQAAVDDRQTDAAGIQTYVNEGPWNSDNSRRNGRFGVDCGGLTAIAIAEMGGANRSAGPGLNIAAAAYRPRGSAITKRGFAQVRVSEAVHAGDVIARMNTNHVMVLFGFRQINIPADAASTNPYVTGNRTARKFLVGESAAARQAGDVGEVTDRKEFVSVPDAETANAYYHTNNKNYQVNSSGSITWDLFKPTANHCWDLTSKGFLRIKNLNFVEKFSIVRPPSQRETTPASELGT